MPKEKRKGEYLKNIKDIIPTGLDLFPYTKGPNAKEKLIKILKESNFEHRRIEKYYNKYVILPEIGDFIKYTDLHEYTRVITRILPGKGFEFETVGYTSEESYNSHEDLLSKLGTNKIIMHIRDIVGHVYNRSGYHYTNKPTTYIDKIGHG